MGELDRRRTNSGHGSVRNNVSSPNSGGDGVLVLFTLKHNHGPKTHVLFTALL